MRLLRLITMFRGGYAAGGVCVYFGKELPGDGEWVVILKASPYALAYFQRL